MKQTSVLFADDEIPYDDDRDGQTRERLLKRIQGATDADYNKGRSGMKRACDVLRTDAIDLTVARTLTEARKAISSPKTFDVVIFDLGWMGDPGNDWSEISGWGLVQSMREARGHATPVIMYSNKFDAAESLARTAAGLGVLPLPKTYTDGSHQTLLCAVRFLAMHAPSQGEQLFSEALGSYRQRQKELRLVARLCLLLIGVVGLVLIATAIALVLGRTNEAIFAAIASVLVGMLLTSASRQSRQAAELSTAAMEDARKNVASEEVAHAAGVGRYAAKKRGA